MKDHKKLFIRKPMSCKSVVVNFNDDGTSSVIFKDIELVSDGGMIITGTIEFPRCLSNLDEKNGYPSGFSIDEILPSNDGESMIKFTITE